MFKLIDGQKPAWKSLGYGILMSIVITVIALALLIGGIFTLGVSPGMGVLMIIVGAVGLIGANLGGMILSVKKYNESICDNHQELCEKKD